MSLRKTEIILGFLLQILQLFAVSSIHVYASMSADKETNFIDKEKSPSAPETVNNSRPKKITMIRFPAPQQSLIKLEEIIENQTSKKGFQWDRSCLTEKKETFKNREEAEKYLQCLFDEREVLEGDFFGINITAYRYVNVFYRRGYIGQKIFQIDKEIARTKSAIKELKK